jgi:hypothetical protein
MIIRRVTKVVAGTTMPRSATPWLPQRSPRGPAKRGSAAAGMPDRATDTWGANSPLRGRIFLWKRLLRPTRSRPILPQPRWDGALRAVCLVRLLAKERPRAEPEGPCEAGIGQRRGCQDRTKKLLERLHPAAGSHLPLEELLRPARSYRSRRRLSRILSRKAAVAPAGIYSALP